MDALRAVIEVFGSFLYQVLLHFRSFTGSFSLAIILLTITIKIVLFPLVRKQLKIARKMRALAPRVNDLRERFKDDRRQLRIELASLYREHGVNPFVGLFLVLVQAPFFTGLWALFRRRGIFEGDKFAGIPLDSTPNLSSLLLHPVWVAAPLLVALATLWQQHMNATDPHQMLMLIVVAAAVGYFAMQVPVGMSVYWVTYSLASVAEAYLVGRETGSRSRTQVHPQRPNRSHGKRSF